MALHREETAPHHRLPVGSTRTDVPRAGSETACCRTLGSGRTVTVRKTAEGFSDDNVEGMVISGTAITHGDGGALTMYENYDDSPAISVAGLEDLLTDPRLTWFTDPSVNAAGADVDVKELLG